MVDCYQKGYEGGLMVEYAITLSMSFRSMLQNLHLDFRMLLPGILLAGAVILVLVRFMKPPKV